MKSNTSVVATTSHVIDPGKRLRQVKNDCLKLIVRFVFRTTHFPLTSVSTMGICPFRIESTTQNMSESSSKPLPSRQISSVGSATVASSASRRCGWRPSWTVVGEWHESAWIGGREGDTSCPCRKFGAGDVALR